jgi:hypothetical protein
MVLGVVLYTTSDDVTIAFLLLSDAQFEQKSLSFFTVGIVNRMLTSAKVLQSL